MYWISRYDAVVKPVVIGDELRGWIVWNGGHGLNFWNDDFENTDTRKIGDLASDDVPFETFLKEAYKWIEDIRKEYKASAGAQNKRLKS